MQAVLEVDAHGARLDDGAHRIGDGLRRSAVTSLQVHAYRQIDRVRNSRAGGDNLV